MKILKPTILKWSVLALGFSLNGFSYAQASTSVKSSEQGGDKEVSETYAGTLLDRPVDSGTSLAEAYAKCLGIAASAPGVVDAEPAPAWQIVFDVTEGADLSTLAACWTLRKVDSVTCSGKCLRPEGHPTETASGRSLEEAKANLCPSEYQLVQTQCWVD
jgi:hypothetical protein